MKIHSSLLGAALGVASLMILATSAAGAAENWKPLFNGRNLDGWDMFMTNPDPSWDVPGLKRDANGRYLEPIGKNNDPLKVFNVEIVDGRPAIHVTGQGFGVITTKESFANFHVRLQIKWGERKWGSKLNSPRDAGLLYFVHGEPGFDHATWPRSVEFQIQEHDIGDLFALGTQVTVKCPDPSLFSPANGPTCPRSNSPRSSKRWATTAWNSPAGATTSTSMPRARRTRYVQKEMGAAAGARPHLLRHLQPPRRPGVCDLIDERHKAILPPDVWGDGKPEGVRQRAAEKMKATAKAAPREISSTPSPAKRAATISPPSSTASPAPPSGTRSTPFRRPPGLLEQGLRRFRQTLAADPRGVSKRKTSTSPSKCIRPKSPSTSPRPTRARSGEGIIRASVSTTIRRTSATRAWTT
jgi:hypothetical protein